MLCADAPVWVTMRRMPMSTKLLTGLIPGNSSHLAIYLNDHLAGATAGGELARRAAKSNAGTPLGDFLAGLATEVREDRESLIAVMRALGIGVDRAKVAAGWTAEKLGRLKLNGQLVGYSPLSRLVELEGLVLGVRGKLALWEALKAAGLGFPPGREVELDGLAQRADKQLSALEEQRREVAAVVLG
jgi:hypothetical protein